MSPSFQDLEQLTPQQRTLLARKLRAKKQQTAATEADAIPRRQGRGPTPASFAQRRLWFLEQLEPGHRAYHLGLALRLQGALDHAALERTLAALVERHEALRTAFCAVDGEPTQVVAEEAPVQLPRELVGAAADRESAARKIVGETFAQPFNLEDGPLWRARLVAFDGEDHLFILVLHHIITDGWSQGILRRELSTLYGAFRRGKSSPLVELPVQYPDFAAWQHRRLRGETLERLLETGREALHGLPPLELPADRPALTLPHGGGRRRVMDLPAAVGQGLGTHARRLGATPFMVLLAAYGGLLGRISGQRDFAVGSPVANRERAELEGVLGFFVNMLVLRLDLSGEPTFAELVKRVRDVALSAYGNQELPFEKLVEELEPERELGRSPLFQTTFAVQNMEGSTLALEGVESRGATGDGEITSRFDLEVFAWEWEEGWRLAWVAAADRFDGSTIARLARQHATLLAAAVADPQERLSNLPLLGVAERHQVLVEWNDTDVESSHRSISQLVEDQVWRTPGAVALEFEGERRTYEELWVQVGELAGGLKALGVGPEVVVGLSVERGLDLVAAVLGILKAGGAYLPLEPSLPEERLEFMAQDAGVGALVVDSAGAERLAVVAEQLAVCVFRLGGERSLRTDAVQHPARRAAHRDGLAYVMYTSGSTGRPKGVGVSHGNVVNLLRSVERRPGLREQDRVLAVSSYAFDISVVDFLLPLAVGARLVLAPTGVGGDGERLGELLATCGATWMQATPTTWRVLLTSGWYGELCKISTGEALPQALAAELLAMGGELWDLYGPTETTVWATGQRVGDTAPSIGRPLMNTSAHVIDSQLRTVPTGGIGELVVGGRGVTRGYLGSPGRTAVRFVPDPFGPRGGRLYRTGDRVRREGGGRLVYLGRFDHQVKVRGYRIELGEIEAVLGKHPAVERAVVVVREGEGGDPRLVAFWVAGTTTATTTVTTTAMTTATATALREHLLGTVPEYMVPASFELLETLPTLPSGKVDRGDLTRRAEQISAVNPVAGGEVPRGPHEELVAELFSSVLGREAVGADASFFALGGHSLLATRLVSRLRKGLGVELPMRQVFETPTVRELARFIGQLQGTPEGAEAEGAAITPLPPHEPLPLSFAQERLWFLDRMEPGHPVLNMPSALRLRGRLVVPALAAALTEVVRRHGSLRTVFEEVRGTPVQKVLPAAAVTLPLLDFSALPAEFREEAFEASRRRHALTPFDLQRGPLLRGRLDRLAEEEHVLLLNLHHIVTDGWSMGLLFRELFSLYNAFAAGRPSPLPELEVQYADFAAWQRRSLSEEALASQIAWWRQELVEPFPVLDLPADRPRGAVQSYRGASLVRALDGELSSRLIEFGPERGATLFMTLLATFKVLLSRLSGQPEVVVGAPIAGRLRGEVEPLIGCFLNTLVLRTRVGTDASFEDVLERVRRRTLGAYAHQEVPFERLLAELQPERDLSRTPLFQVFFNMLEFPARKEPVPGLEIEMLSLEGLLAKFDLTIYAARRAEGIVLRFAYNADLFDAARMEGMVEQYVALLARVVEQPDESLGSFPLRVEGSRQVLPDPAIPLCEDFHGAIHDLFALHARRAPHRPAVMDRDGVLTYGGLAELSGALASRLHRVGIGRGDVVALFAHRGATLVWAILGVLEAGAAFVILEPAHPAARLLSTFEQSGAKFWIELPGSDPPDEVRMTVEEALGESCLRLPERSGWGPWLEQEAAEELVAAQRPRFQAHAADLSCIAFTSGSTGTPKGICGSHGALTHFLPWQEETFALTPEDRFSMLSGVAHDPLQRDIFTPLSLGAAVSIPDPEQMFRPGWLAGWLARERVSITHLTPALSQFLTEVPKADQEKRLHALRWAFYIGDVLTRRDVHRLKVLAPSSTSINLYGSTETQRALSYHVVEPSSTFEDGGSLPLGRGMAGMQLLVLTAAGEPAAVGELGEVCIRSPHLARGYLHDASLTARRFTPTPGGGMPGERLYRTGDLGRYLPDGDVVFVGRADRQVNIRGFRIELGEIEVVLGEHPEVIQAVAGVHGGSPENSILVAWVVPQDGAKPTVGALREWVGRKLPTFMVPAACVLLEQIPLNANGKVDRIALAQRAEESLAKVELGGRSRDEEGLVPARNRYELHLLSLFEQVLRKNPIGVEDSFFELGGHSLLATRLFALIEKSFEQALPISTLFRAPSVARLAKVLREEGHEAIWSSVVPIHPWGERPPLFCVHGITGDPFIYRHLAEYLGPDQPLYGLRAQGLDGESQPYMRVEDMAAHYLEEIHRVQPVGPYYLSGFCFGGTVAAEMARQLLARGEEVALLAVFDTHANITRVLPQGIRRRYALQRRLWMAKSYLAKTKTLPPHRRLLEISTRAARIFRRLFGQQKRKLPPQPFIATPSSVAEQDVTTANRIATRRYTPDFYPGSVTLFRSTEAIGPIFLDPRLGWQVLAAGGLEILDVPGLHHAMFDEPHVQVLAARLRSRLEAAQKVAAERTP